MRFSNDGASSCPPCRGFGALYGIFGGMSSADIQRAGAGGENMHTCHENLPNAHFSGEKRRKTGGCIGVKCCNFWDIGLENHTLFNEIPRSAGKCKIIRLTISVQALILRATKFHERRTQDR